MVRLNFDAAAPADPTGEVKSWAADVSDTFQRFDDLLAPTIDVHGAVLGTSVVRAAEELRLDDVYGFLRTLDTMPQFGGGRPDAPPHPDREPVLALASPRSQRAIDAFAEKLASLISAIEQVPPRTKLAIHFPDDRPDDSDADEFHRQFPGNRWGDARYGGLMSERLTDAFIIGGGRVRTRDRLSPKTDE